MLCSPRSQLFLIVSCVNRTDLIQQSKTCSCSDPGGFMKKQSQCSQESTVTLIQFESVKRSELPGIRQPWHEANDAVQVS